MLRSLVYSLRASIACVVLLVVAATIHTVVLITRLDDFRFCGFFEKRSDDIVVPNCTVIDGPLYQPVCGATRSDASPAHCLLDFVQVDCGKSGVVLATAWPKLVAPSMSEANLRATAGDVIAFFDTLPTNASSVSVRIKPNATLGVEELRRSFFLSEWADNVATVGNDSFVHLIRLFGCDAVHQQRDDLKAVGTAAYCGIALFGWTVFCLCGVGCKIDDEPAPAPASQQQAPAPAPHRMRQARMQRQQEPDEPEPAVDHVFDTSESFAVCWRCGKRLPGNTLACTNCFAVLPDGVRNNAYTFAGFGVENGSSVDDSSEDKDKNCTICLSQLEAGDEVVSLPCFHRFHTECILAWFKKEDTCAICREGVALAVIKAEEEVKLSVAMAEHRQQSESHDGDDDEDDESLRTAESESEVF